MNLSRKITTALQRPGLAGEYLWYLVKRCFSRDLTRRLTHGVSVGGFETFSQYHAAGGFVTPAEWRFICSLDLHGKEVFDVGANIGVVSCLLASAFATARVHAFEPSPETFEIMMGNFSRNHLRNVIAVRSAMGDRVGEVLFSGSAARRDTAAIASDGTPGARPVPVTTLDHYTSAHSIDRIAFLKVDVEGFEDLVFAGADRLLRERRIDCIYYELSSLAGRNSGRSLTAASEILLKAGYTLHRLDEDGATVGVDLSRIEGDFYENWIARPA
jgi:FkbM family methyltransferase